MVDNRGAAMTTQVDRLCVAIDEMAERYGDAMDWRARFRSGEPDAERIRIADQYERSARIRRLALRRLICTLAELADGAS